VQTGGAAYHWVKQGDPKPVSDYSFTDGTTLTATKGAGIIVTTHELARAAVPGAADALRDDLIAGLAEFTDTSFLDPAAAAVADTQPASVTNGTTPIAGTGDIVADVATLLGAFYDASPGGDPVLVMGGGPRSALTGVNRPAEPIVLSGAAGVLGIIVALDPRRILVADGGVEIDVSQYAAFQMDSAPDAPATASSIIVDLWSRNLVGLRIDRTVNWSAAPDSVQYLTLA
jgi:hypothetical protein